MSLSQTTLTTKYPYGTLPVMKREKQLYLIKSMKTKEAAFGGSLLKSNPEIARPLSTKDPIHMVLRSTKATGTKSFLKHSKSARQTIEKTCAKYGVKIY